MKPRSSCCADFENREREEGGHEGRFEQARTPEIMIAALYRVAP